MPMAITVFSAGHVCITILKDSYSDSIYYSLAVIVSMLIVLMVRFLVCKILSKKFTMNKLTVTYITLKLVLSAMIFFNIISSNDVIYYMN